MYPSELPDLKIKILNYVRSNPGRSPVDASKALNAPLGFVHMAVAQLKQEGLLQLSNALKIGRRQQE